jgi:hypothetical protein
MVARLGIVSSSTPNNAGSLLLAIGTTVTDAYNPTNTITNTNVSIADDPDIVGGKVAVFNAVGQTLTSKSAPKLTGDFTIQVVFQQNALIGSHQAVWMLSSTLLLHIQGGSRQLFLRINGSYYGISFACTSTTWCRTTVQRVGSTLTTYVNGVSVSVNSLPGTVNSLGDGVDIGRGTEGGTIFPFGGYIRSLLIHSGPVPSGFVV